jgi:uncharacterized protein (DUF488 family)
VNPAEVFTLGHSTRSLEELVRILEGAGVKQLIDVRTAPGSRRHPQFGRAALAMSLPEHGLEYRHEPALGGFRRPRPDSPNRGWEQPAFRGYADHMTTEEFRMALERVERLARERPACLMCAEARWWRCHRRLIADALAVRGWDVIHLGVGSRPLPHELTPFAVVHPEGTIAYPPAQGALLS